MPRPYHLLTDQDCEWALDHSRRAYRVRLANNEEHAGANADTVAVAIIRLFDGERIIRPECDAANPNEWEDSDDNGSFHFCLENFARQVRGEVWL